MLLVCHISKQQEAVDVLCDQELTCFQTTINRFQEDCKAKWSGKILIVCEKMHDSTVESTGMVLIPGIKADRVE